MTQSQKLGRLAGLAVGIGIGAVLVVTPGIASADDMQISIDGFDLFPTAGNTATAVSGMGDIAIAFGNDSIACAGCSAQPGTGDFAFANGANSEADAGLGNFDDAMATGTRAFAGSGAGNFDTAVANGDSSSAIASGSVNALGNNDFAEALGLDAKAYAGSILTSTPSSNDVAVDLDPFGTLGSTAVAGLGNGDLATIFGDNLTAGALGNFMYDIVSALFNIHN
jgi:hypothetical protein